MRNYPAKLLLFGEHVLLLGASALAVPVPAFSGRWEMAASDSCDPAHRKILFQFADSDILGRVSGLDTNRFREELSAGLSFVSNIPTGYGLGSSGALCAAIYDRYVTDKTSDAGELKRILGGMESFFHGSSSGIDPLTSYLHAPLLIQNKTEVSLAPVSNGQDAPLLFLIDTQTPRQTGPLVQWFIRQSKEPAFATALETELLPSHEAMLQAWMHGDAAAFWIHLRQVSAFQFAHFHPMIAPGIYATWEKSLDNQDYSLKICGAGGGGFMLGFARNRAAIQALEASFPIIFPFENKNKEVK